MQIPFLAHAQMIEELSATPLEIGYEKTLHIIFPTEVKYCNAGNDHILAEKVSASSRQILNSIHIPFTIVTHQK